MEAVLEFAEDLLIDIPQFWNYFGVMIATCITDKVLDLAFIKHSSVILKDIKLIGNYSSAVLSNMNKLDPVITLDLWSQSRMSLDDLSVGDDDPLRQILVNTVNGQGGCFATSLDSVLANHDVNSIFEFMSAEVGSEVDYKTLRVLIDRVTMTCIINNSGSFTLNEDLLRSFGVIVMKKYLDAVNEKERVKKELEALYSLQSLVTSLEHPNKLLHSVFDVLYDCDVISEVRLKLVSNVGVKFKILFVHIFCPLTAIFDCYWLMNKIRDYILKQIKNQQ